jgi:hypothetical protein
MSKFLDLVGTILSDWQIGNKQSSGINTIKFSNSTGIGTLSWNPSANRTITLPDASATLAQLNTAQYGVVNRSTSFTLATSRACNVVTVAGVSITVPSNANASGLLIQSQIEIVSIASYTILVPDSGVTLYRYGFSSTSQVIAINNLVTLKKIATDTWVIYG